MKNVIYIAFAENVKVELNTITTAVYNSKNPFEGKNKKEVLAIAKRFARNHRCQEAASQIDFYKVNTDGLVSLNAKHIGQYEMGDDKATFVKLTETHQQTWWLNISQIEK